MQTKNIRPGTEYAFASFPRSTRLGAKHGVRRVTVVDTGNPHGITIRFTPDGAEVQVAPASIIGTWEQHTELRAEAKAHAAARQARYLAAATRIRVLTPKDARLPWWADAQVHADGSQTTEGQMTVTELADLLDEVATAAFERGVLAERDANARQDGALA